MAARGTENGRSRRRAWRRPVALALLGIAAFGFLLVAGAAIALRSPRVQQLAIEGISESVEPEFGVSIAAEGFDLRMLRGRLDVHRLELRAGDAEPFARIERVRVRFRPLTLLRGSIRLPLVELERPEVNLDAPLPVAGARDPQAQPLESIALIVDRLSVTGGSARGMAPESAREFLEHWGLSDIHAEGGFDGRRMTISSLSAGARLSRGETPALDLRIEAAAAAELSGEADIGKLRVTGDDLTLESSLNLPSDLDRLSGTFQVTTDVGSLLGRAPTGPVNLDGRVDLGAWSGALHLAAPDQHASLLVDLDLIDAELANTLELADTRLGLELALDLERSRTGARSLAGEIGAVATRGRRTILELDARPRLSFGEGALFASESAVALEVEADARALPGEAGVRTVSAAVSSGNLESIDSWQIDRGGSTIEQPSIDRLLAVVSELWPELLAASTIRDVPSLGALSATADFGGALVDPWVEVRARVSPDTEARVRLNAKGRPLANEWTIDASGVDVEVGRFTNAASGRVDFTGRVEDLLGAASGSLEVAARDLATESGALFSTLGLGVNGTRKNVAWRLDGDLATKGGVRGEGTLRPEKPLRSAGGNLTWETGDVRVPRLDSTFSLSGGVLSATSSAQVGAELPRLEAQVEVPLLALDAVPELGDLSALPIERSAGPVVLTWRAPERDWREFVRSDWAQRVGRFEAGSTGSASVDLACLACSTATARLQGLVLEVDGRRAQAEGDLVLGIEFGRAQVEPWSLTGDGLDLDLSGEADLSPEWRSGSPIEDLVTDIRGGLSAALASTWLDSLPVEVVTPGTIELAAEVSGSIESLRGSGKLSAPELGLTLDAYPGLTAAGPKAEVSLSQGILAWKSASVRLGEAEVRSEGRALLRSPLAETSGTVEVTSGLPVVTGATLPFELADGWLQITEGRLTTVGGDGTVALDMPIEGDPGATARAEWSLPVNDWAPLVTRLGGGDDPQVLELASRGRLVLPLDRPALTQSQVELSEGRIVVRGRETFIDPKVELLLRDGRLEVVPFSLRTADQNFRFQGEADLVDDWKIGDEPSALVERFEVDGKGEVDSGLLNPFLAGGRAEGSLALDLELSGTPTTFGGRIRAEGPGASILYRSPYLARFESPSFEVSIQDGRVALERGSLRLNEGALAVSGVLSEDGRTDLGLEITDSVFRLDYGLLVTLRGDLRFQLGADSTSTVSGVLDVERGALTRSVQLDLDLLSQLLAPIDLTTTEDDPLDLIALDLSVRTREGVRIKNNLGDLLVRWEPLAVTGTLARPIIEGRLDVDPGGLLYAYGQTVRLDKAAIEYPGEEGVEPRLDFEVTTSLEDPTIGQLAGADPFKAVKRNQESSAAASEEVTADLARYYGEQFAGKVSESVGVKVSLRPLLIFGETDPGARLTVSRDLSANLALAASVDLRSAEGRTYLLEAHELRALPRLVGQAFTDDSSAYGGALLQRQEWGGTRPADTGDLPRISKIVADPPKGVSRRGIKRSLGLEKGDLFSTDQRFVAEVELVDYLLRKGYPDARVSVRAVPDERRERRVRLEIDIQPGPFVEFAFEGEKIPKPLRSLIRALYRPDFFEPESIEEMRSETVRALRSRGFLEPKVDILVEPLEARDPATDRRVTVRTEGGVRTSPDPPTFLGLPPEDVEILNVTFANEVQRVELAVGLASADRRLLSALAAIGYPEARIVTRYQSLGERLLTVEIEAGPRERVASVSLGGISVEETPEISEDQVTPLLVIASGDPLRRNRLSRSAVAIERFLGSRGYLDARVRTVLDSIEDDPYSKEVRFVVEPGTLSRLDGVEFKGLRSTKERYARKVAGLEAGKPLARDDLSRARTSLWKTGLFSAVGAEVVELDSQLDRVVFDLEERDRYRLTYGIRWDSEDGLGAVVDATDDNFLGRGWTLGLRALSSSEEDSLRGLGRVPRAFGGTGSLELFAAARQLTEIASDVIFGITEVPVEVFESTLQYSLPITERTTFRVYGRYTDTTRELPFITLKIRNPKLGFQYVYDSRSPEPLTQRGVFASVDLSGSKEFLGGDLSYVRTFSQLSIFRPAGKLLGADLSWSQSYRLGLADAFDQVLTREDRFFAGGEYSVRGYETQSLGEQEQFGSITQPAGGNALLVVNQELRWRLFTDYTLVLFADGGNVWTRVEDYGSDLFASGGLGIRATTPVGLLRLDIARPFNGRLGIDPEYKIYFGLGTTF